MLDRTVLRERRIGTPLARPAGLRYTRTVATDPATAFDAMAASYDELEPWYEHLYAVLHGLVRRELAPTPGAKGLRALDAGCGTGFQTAILVDLGYETLGVDLSAGLLRAALPRCGRARLAQADVEALPCRDGTLDLVVSCGSTLSFVRRPDRAISEIARVLRPGGRAFLEVEHRWSLDLVWRLASSAVGDPLGYEVTARAAARALAQPFADGVWIGYPGYPTLRLFTRSEINRLLGDAGLVLLRAWGLHSATNLLPSTVLHRPRLGRILAALYRGLCTLDRALAVTGPGRALANSLVILAERPSEPWSCSPGLGRSSGRRGAERAPSAVTTVSDT
jgi:SAM-dependent methyltransferase